MRELLDRQLFEVALAKMVPAVAGIAFVGMAARLHSASSYGVFALVFTAANLLSVLSVVWISQSIFRFGSDTGIPQGQVVGASATLTLAVALLGVLALPWWPEARARVPLSAAWPAVMLALALTLNSVVAAFAVARQRFIAYRRSELARATMLLLGTALLQGQGGGEALVLVYALATAVPSILLYVAMQKPGSAEVQRATTLEWLQRFSRYGWPMTVWAGLQATQALMERALMSTVLDAEAFGRFIASADVLYRGFGLALAPVVTLMHSRLMKHAGGRTELDETGFRMVSGGAKLVALGALAMVVVVVAGRDVIAWIAPGTAQLSMSIILGLCASGTLWVLALIAHKPLELACATGTMSLLLLAALLLQFGLLSALAPRIGAAAMPIASSIAAVVYIGGCVLASKLTLPKRALA